MRLNTILTAVVVGGITVANQGEAQQVFIHGFATQAYGQTTDYAQVGLAGNGTADMRAAALQGRLAFFSTGTQFVVQGVHRRVGGSPLASVIDDFELDWAFAEQRIGSFSARVGRMPIPKGLVNEIRDVGTLLPFYTASKAFYLDGVETVDGVTGRFSQTLGSFDVEAQAFKGKIPIVVSISGQDGPKRSISMETAPTADSWPSAFRSKARRFSAASSTRRSSSAVATRSVGTTDG